MQGNPFRENRDVVATSPQPEGEQRTVVSLTEKLIRPVRSFIGRAAAAAQSTLASGGLPHSLGFSNDTAHHYAYPR